MNVYHTTTSEAVAAILREGFRDATGSYGFNRMLTGVFFSVEPVGSNEGAKGDPTLGDPVLVLDIPEAEIEHYGWTDAIREWCIPADLANKYGPPAVRWVDLDLYAESGATLDSSLVEQPPDPAAGLAED